MTILEILALLSFLSSTGYYMFQIIWTVTRKDDNEKKN